MKKSKWLTAGLAAALAFSLLPGMRADDPVRFNIYRAGAWPAFPADGGKGHQKILDEMKAYGIEGIDFDLTTIGGTEYFDKLNVLAYSGGLPDYFSNNMINLRAFADQDLLLPLEDKLDKLPAARKLMRDADIEALTHNDHLYALPVAYLEGAINGPNTAGLVIRQDWLDKVGMQIPKTLDELGQVLQAFTEKDPDGNGKADTVGYLGTNKSLFSTVFGAYGIQPTFWMEDGKGGLIYGAMKPETVEVFRTLKDWYSKGYIDPDVFSNDGAMQDQKLATSRGGVYENSAFTLDPANPEHAALLKETPTAKLSPLAAVKGKNGDFGIGESAPGYGNIHSVSKECKDVDKLFQLLNWVSDGGEHGGMYLASVGVEGEHFEFNKDKTRIKMLKSYDDIYADGLGNPIRFLQVVDRRWMTEEAAHAFEVYKNDYKKNLFWKTTPGMTEHPDTVDETLLRKYLQDVMVNTTSPEDAYKAFVEEFKQMGGDKITEEVNESYKAKDGAKKDK